MARTLIVPGLHDRGRNWQLWLESRLTDAARVRIRKLDEPDLTSWSGDLQQALDEVNTPCWMIARDFGALAAMSGLQDIRDRILGWMLVAPAAPEYFGFPPSLASNPGLPGLILASAHDSGLRLTSSAFLAERCSLRLVQPVSAEPAPYAINGAWPEIFALFESLKRAYAGMPQGLVAD